MAALLSSNSWHNLACPLCPEDSITDLSNPHAAMTHLGQSHTAAQLAAALVHLMLMGRLRRGDIQAVRAGSGKDHKELEVRSVMRAK